MIERGPVVGATQVTSKATITDSLKAREEVRLQQFVIGDDETESESSVGSRSFLNRVNDQVRKRQKRSSMNVTEDSEKHSAIW